MASGVVVVAAMIVEVLVSAFIKVFVHIVASAGWGSPMVISVVFQPKAAAKGHVQDLYWIGLDFNDYIFVVGTENPNSNREMLVRCGAIG